MTDNFVDAPVEGFVIAVQYWTGDEARALRLAWLIADIERKPRSDVTLALCRRFDCPESDDAKRTWWHCCQKMPSMMLQSEREGTGHPDGSFGLWAGTVEAMAERWMQGRGNPSVFTVEHDGCPLSVDWIDRLKAEHERALANGKRVTGCLMDRPGPGQHVNGTMLINLSMWLDRPSIHRTPIGQAWDVFHRVAFASECQPSNLIKNIYGGKNWSPAAMSALAKETAWLSSAKDDSALTWAENGFR